MTFRALSHLVAALLAIAPSVLNAEPSPPIERLIKTPATAFDVFLYQLFDLSKCFDGHFSSGQRQRAPVCMTGIEYSREENVISMSFLVSEDHKKMKEFSAATNDDERRAILGEIMDDLAETVGLTPMGPPVNFKFGLIQYTPIRYGSGTKEFDEEAIKEEISRRTKLVLVAKYDGFSYWLYRGLHGEVSLLKQRFRKERYEYPD